MFSSPLRRIITDSRLLAGRWHVSGTTIAVGEVRLDHAARGSTPDYAYPGLSSDELAACLDFTFPPTRETSVAMLAGMIVISCACGEETSASGVLGDSIPCVCGRIWRVRVLLDAVQESGTAAGTTTATPSEIRAAAEAILAAP